MRIPAKCKVQGAGMQMCDRAFCEERDRIERENERQAPPGTGQCFQCKKTLFGLDTVYGFSCGHKFHGHCLRGAPVCNACLRR